MKRPNHHKNAMLTLWALFKWVCIVLGCAASIIGLVILGAMAVEAAGPVWSWVGFGLLIVGLIYWAAYDESVSQERAAERRAKVKIEEQNEGRYRPD